MDVIDSPKTNLVFDATFFTSLQGCARKADFAFNHRLQSSGGKSNSLETGSIAHSVLETYYKSRIQGVPHNNSVGLGLTAGELYVRGCKFCIDGSQTCGHKVGEYPGVVNTPMDSTSSPSRTGWKTVLDTCQQYFDFYRGDPWVPLEVEKVLSKIIYEDDRIRVLWKAKIDALMDIPNYGVFSVDHKTMKSRRMTMPLNNQFKGQAIVTEKRGMWKNNIGFQTTLKPAEKFTREYIHYTADALHEFANEIVPFYAYQLVDYSESGYFPPNYNQCDSKFGPCIFTKVCEANRNMRAEELRINFVVGPEWNPTNEDE